MQGLAVLGSTGSIGTQTLQIVDQFPEKFRVISLAAGRNIDLLEKQIAKYRPGFVSVLREEDLPRLREGFPETEFATGDAGLGDAVLASGVDTVIMGIVGFAALAPTLKAVEAGKRVALANKEVLVVGGALLQARIGDGTAECIPVDSEHNALYQLLLDRPREEVEKLVLTASGGPLWKFPDLPLDDVTPERAIKHPNWAMGPKISVDSATMMNKGLELIEAHFLFDFPADKIDIWVHPQSLVHGAIWLKDNSFLAQMNKPDMRCSIGYAMGYPERLEGVIPPMNMGDLARLEFLRRMTPGFPAPNLARRALESGPSHLVVLNGVNELAVEGFLQGKILFPRIAANIEEALAAHRAIPIRSIEDIFALDREIRDSFKIK